jgi:hypothetical protein
MKAGISLQFEPLQIGRIRTRLSGLTLIEKETTLLSMEDNSDALKRKHADLEYRLGEEIQRPNPDQTIITQIKREKLKVKDALASMESA